ncbi:hypothetical protein [Proteiniclasticum sp.]|uniref:hypothetical protein n=1 Tax=Proteiniclasticum sp. TaxID=2053595 RepID=UPI00289FF5AB|nr:hypothetical protein [Proteiniclasticum sp.]
MKIIILMLSMLFLTSCSAAELVNDNDTMMEKSAPAETALTFENSMMIDIMNFRTSDSLDMVSENRIIRTFEEFNEYNNDYAILENPFFIDDMSLNKLKKVNEDFFVKQGFVAVVLVESSGSNSVLGENLIIKDNIAEAFINRTEAGIGTSDIATRHVLYEISQEELQNIDEVKVTVSLSK